MKFLNCWILSASVVSMMLALASCSSDSPSDPSANEKKPESHDYTTLRLSPSQNEARLANNDFAISLLKDVMELQNGESTVISPFSLYTALSMAANGDTGDTRDKILEVLGFDAGESGLEKLNSFNSYMIENLPNLDSQAYALVSNSLWLNNMVIYDVFSEALSKWYGAEIHNLKNLRNNDARNQINRWCNENTKGRIRNFLKENLDCDAALINATYFRGWWDEEFDKEDTKKTDFTNLDGTKSKVDMMFNRTFTSYAKTSYAEMMTLDYGNGNFRMVCILPYENSDINTCVSKLTAAELSENLANAKTIDCALRMPKFDITGRQDLTQLLEHKGLTCIQNPGFNSILTNGNMFISKVFQETHISNDEAGTIAAAVTAEIMYGASGEVPEFLEISLDRPFLFLIEETSTHTILFAGAVTKL